MIFSILVCFATFAWLLCMLRQDRISLGLPIAYLFALLLIHVPGAIAHVVGEKVLLDTQFTEVGIGFTAIGAVSFVAGVWLARFATRELSMPRGVNGLAENRHQFSIFCLVAGWFCTYGLSFLRSIPSIGAAVAKGGAVWMLGVMLGLRAAVQRGDLKAIGLWLSALAVFPILTLLMGGFLSYGSTATIIVISVLAISTRSHWRVAVGTIIAAIFAFNMFLSYFQNRDQIRGAVWGGASWEERIDRSLDMIRDIGFFDPANPDHLVALDTRLNQNYFAGLAAARIEAGQVDYLYGRSVWEGLTSLVPRVIWPNKPITGGSPKIVSDMTGLELSEDTSFGVGNVMEFQINFGIPGLVIGFVFLGWLLGLLDRKAAKAEADGDLGKLLILFLPAVALIQPNGAIAELTGGAVSGLIAAFAYRWAWARLSPRTVGSVTAPARERTRTPTRPPESVRPRTPARAPGTGRPRSP